MKNTTAIEAEIIEDNVRPGMAISQPAGLQNLHGTSNPKQMIELATGQADVLADVIESRKLYAHIQGKKHVTVEGWTTLGAMVGVFPVLQSVDPLPRPDGFEIQRKEKGEWITEPLPPGRTFGFVARVEARTLHGEVVGSAESECSREESTWATRDDYALRSMAQTRATSKALRLPLGFIMHLAGFNPTPEEEMPGGGAKIPKVPDMKELPDGWKPEPWAKAVVMVLTGGNLEEAKTTWEQLAEAHPPADAKAGYDKGEIDALVDAAHTLFAEQPADEWLGEGYGS